MWITYGLLLVGIVSFGIAMEEISWGQRLFNLQTPGQFAKYNTQQEFNIHNNVSLFPYVYLLYGALSMYGVSSGLVFPSFIFSVPRYAASYFLPNLIYVILRYTRFHPVIHEYMTVRLFQGFDIIHEWEEFSETFLVAGLLLWIYKVLQKVYMSSKSTS